MKSPKKLVALLVVFAFAVFIAASMGVNAIPPGGPIDPEFETEQTYPEVYGPVESEPADAEPRPWPPGPCYWVCECEFNPPLPPTCYCYIVCE